MNEAFKILEGAKKGNKKPLEALAEFYQKKADYHKSKANFWLAMMFLSLGAIVLVWLI